MWSKGITWIDDCRIPFVDNDKPTGGYGAARIGYGNEYEYDGKCGEANTQGRFPANILVSDDMLNDGLDRKGFSGGGGPTRFANATGGVKLEDYNYYKDKGSSSRYYDIDKWFEKILNYE